MMRIWHQNQADSIYHLPTAVQLITQSTYTGQNIIDETKTITLLTFIWTRDTYFHEKLLYINAMSNEFGVPSLFITLTMAENKWTHLEEILKSTDNGNTVPTNRPLHTTLHFIHHKQELKRTIWLNPNNSNWRELLHFFERVEFQNRGVAYTHLYIWVTKNIEDIINDHTIQSDLLDLNLELKFY